MLQLLLILLEPPPYHTFIQACTPIPKGIVSFKWPGRTAYFTLSLGESRRKQNNNPNPLNLSRPVPSPLSPTPPAPRNLRRCTPTPLQLPPFHPSTLPPFSFSTPSLCPLSLSLSPTNLLQKGVNLSQKRISLLISGFAPGTSRCVSRLYFMLRSLSGRRYGIDSYSTERNVKAGSCGMYRQGERRRLNRG